MPIGHCHRALTRVSLVTYVTIGIMIAGARPSIADATPERGELRANRIVMGRGESTIGRHVTEFVRVIQHSNVENDREAIRTIPHVPVIWPSVHGTTTFIQVSKEEIPVGFFPALPGANFQDIGPDQASNLVEGRFPDIEITPEPTNRIVFGLGPIDIDSEYTPVKLRSVTSSPTCGFAALYKLRNCPPISPVSEHSYSDPGFRIEEVSLPSFPHHAPIAPRP